MNLNMITPENKTEDLLLSITKICETLIEQTHRKPEETLEFKMSKPREIFQFTRSLEIKEDWMLGLVDLEVYNSIFNITEQNNKFEIYRDMSEKFGFLKLKDEIEETLNSSNITNEHLNDEILGPRIINEFIKLSNEKKNKDGYMILLLGYARSLFQDFESYLRIVVGLPEEDIQLILKEYNSLFITYELTPGIYSIQDISDTIHTFSDHMETIQIEYDDISMKTKIILKYIGEPKMFVLGTLRFDERSFFHTLVGFAPYWNYKPPGVYTSDKILKLKTTNKFHLKCDVINGSVVNGNRQSILYSFVLDKKPGYKIFSEPETVHYNKINKSVLNTITFYLEDDNNKEVSFNGETLTFTLQMIKIQNNTSTYTYISNFYMFLCYK